MFATFFYFSSFLASGCLATVFVQSSSFSSVQGCISEGSERNGDYSFATYKAWSTKEKVLSAQGAPRIRLSISDYSRISIYVQGIDIPIQPFSKFVSFFYCPFLIIIFLAVEKVSLLMLHSKCSNLSTEVLSVHAGLRKSEVWCALNQGEK